MVWSQKFRLAPDSASNAVVKRSVLSVFINQRCAECVCLYYGLRVCGQKYIFIICDRFRKSCTTVEQARWRHQMKFHKNCPPPKWRAGCAPESWYLVSISRGGMPVSPPADVHGQKWWRHFFEKFRQNAQILKSRVSVSVSNLKSRVSVLEFLMKSRSRCRLEILTRSRSRSRCRLEILTRSRSRSRCRLEILTRSWSQSRFRRLRSRLHHWWCGSRIAIQPASEFQNPTRIGLDFEKNSTGSDMDIHTALIISVKCLLRVFSDINRIGSNISTGLPD